MAKTFQRAERLKRRKVIGALFQKGQSFGQYPLRAIFVKLEEREGAFPVQFAVSVPKRKFPKAAHRNRIRRRVKEAYRLNKHRLYGVLEEQEGQLALMVLYVAKEELPFEEIEGAMKGLVRRLGKKARGNQ